MDIVNRVAESDIVVYDLAQHAPGEIAALDLAPWLVRGLILREKNFRAHVKGYDWAQHAGQHVAVHCSTDAIIPTWAYMLVGGRLRGVAGSVGIGTPEALRRDVFVRALEAEDWRQFADQIVVVKGCGAAGVPEVAYAVATQKLMDVARKVMYGEPCSSVPIWRRPSAPKNMTRVAKSASVSVKPLGTKSATRPASRPASLSDSLPDA